MSLVIQVIVWEESRMGCIKSKQGLSQEDLEFLKTHTRYDENTIKEWYKGFKQDCPNGRLTPPKFVDMYKLFFPSGNAEQFCDHVFRTFDTDKNGFIDFREFLLAIDVTSAGTPEEKLKWAFRSDFIGLWCGFFLIPSSLYFRYLPSLPPHLHCRKSSKTYLGWLYTSSYLLTNTTTFKCPFSTSPPPIQSQRKNIFLYLPSFVSNYRYLCKCVPKVFIFSLCPKKSHIVQVSLRKI